MLNDLAIFLLATAAVFLLGRQFIRPGRRKAPWRSRRQERPAPAGPPTWAQLDRGRLAADQLQAVMAATFHRRRLLSQSEARVMRVVEAMLYERRPDWRVMAQVSLGEVLGSKNADAYFAINSKRCDLLLVNEESLPVAAIEYHGTGHHQGTSAARDAVKKEALRRAGVGYLEVNAGDRPDDLRRKVAPLLRPIAPGPPASAPGSAG